MSEFAWDDSLDVGIEAMNNDHKQIIADIARVVDCLDRGESPARSFDQLNRTVVQHFAAEERLLADRDYSNFRTHKLIHENLLEKMQGFRQDITNGKLNAPDLISFLRMWLKSHIKGIDRKYAVEFGVLV